MPTHSARLCAIAAALAAVLLPAAAHASLFGEENAPLYTLVAQTTTQISQLAQALATARETYEETRRYVGMAQDALDAFQDMKAFGESVITRPDLALDGLFPDAAYLRQELSTPRSWMQGTGELQRRVRVCLAGGASCAEFYERVRGQQAQAAISQTFGTAPGEARPDIGATDTEAAAALVSASKHEGRAAFSREQYDALLSKCTRGDITSCQAAANMATILEAQGTADVNEQLATANRLHATQLANTAADRKRDVQEAEQRRKAVRAGFQDLSRVHLVPTGPDAVPVAEVP